MPGKELGFALGGRVGTSLWFFEGLLLDCSLGFPLCVSALTTELGQKDGASLGEVDGSAIVGKMLGAAVGLPISLPS